MPLFPLPSRIQDIRPDVFFRALISPLPASAQARNALAVPGGVAADRAARCGNRVRAAVVARPRGEAPPEKDVCRRSAQRDGKTPIDPNRLPPPAFLFSLAPHSPALPKAKRLSGAKVAHITWTAATNRPTAYRRTLGHPPPSGRRHSGQLNVLEDYISPRRC